jgi:hypothetical protein
MKTIVMAAAAAATTTTTINWIKRIRIERFWQTGLT